MCRPIICALVIIENEGRYVLLDDRTMLPVADLAAEGFSEEGFARHLGTRVIVRGTSSPAETRTLFRVRGIETVSPNCAPKASHNQGY